MSPRRLFASLVTVLLLAAVSPWPALAASPDQNTPRDAKLYDASGRYQGKVTAASPGQTKSYDKSGRYQGKAVQTGKTVKIYDKSGRYIGRATTR